jgi:hypothetical protein
MRHELLGHEVFTTAYMKWNGIENGELLKLAADAGFGALITNDRGLEYEQNQSSLPLSVIVLLVKTNTIEFFRPLYPKLAEALRAIKPGELLKISE